MIHAPAPWFVDRNPGGIVITHIPESRFELNRIANVCDGPRREGNAALIAAAPDLLTAAQLAASLFDESLNGESHMSIDAMDATECLSILDAAIAKAKGESQ